jgi:surfeit locus 1 family protein
MKVQVHIFPTLILLSLAIIFAALGNWQLDRKAEKQDLIKRFDQAEEMSLQQATSTNPDFARVRVFGHYETNWQLLIDNSIWQGQPGVHVLNLFYPKQGMPVLVDRGWLAMNPDRRSLPEVQTPAGEIVISGLLSRLPEGGVRLGNEDVIEELEGSILLTYLDIENVAKAAELAIAPRILKLDASDPSGFQDRDWQPAVIMPAQHQAYALQWFALSVAAVILIFTMGMRLRLS